MRIILFPFIFLWSHKGKVSLLGILTLVFFIALFPVNDLSDLVSGLVAKSGQGLSVNFKKMGLNFFPSPTVTLEKFTLETLTTAKISAENIVVKPSIIGLISQKPYGEVKIDGALGGNLELAVSKGKAVESTQRKDEMLERLKLEVTAQKLSLADIRDIAQLPVLLKGQVQMKAEGEIDPTFEEQPDIEIDLQVKQFELPSMVFNSPQAGAINIPEIKLSSLSLKGRLSGGQFLIQSLKFGDSQDQISGSLKGKINLRLQGTKLKLKDGTERAGSPIPVYGGYNLDADFQIKKELMSKTEVTLALIFIEKFKEETSTGASFKFKVAHDGSEPIPTFDALR